MIVAQLSPILSQSHLCDAQADLVLGSPPAPAGTGLLLVVDVRFRQALACHSKSVEVQNGCGVIELNAVST